MGNSCSPGCRLWCLLWRLLCCPFSRWMSWMGSGQMSQFLRDSYLLMLCWLVGCFGFSGPLRQYFSLYRAVLCWNVVLISPVGPWLRKHPLGTPYIHFTNYPLSAPANVKQFSHNALRHDFLQNIQNGVRRLKVRLKFNKLRTFLLSLILLMHFNPRTLKIYQR